MYAIHDHFTHGTRQGLKTAGMGLGLVRLLQDAGRTVEAKTILCSLENALDGVTEASNKPNQGPWKATRLNGLSRTSPFAALSGKRDLVQSTN